MLQYAKAIIAAAIAGLTALSTELIDGTLTTQDWIQAIIATLVALGAVYAVPNRTSAGGDTQSGLTLVETLVVLLVIAVVLILLGYWR